MNPEMLIGVYIIQPVCPTSLYHGLHNRLNDRLRYAAGLYCQLNNPVGCMFTLCSRLYNRLYKPVVCTTMCSQFLHATGLTHRLYVRLHHATRVAAWLDVGGCKYLTRLILATECQTGQMVTMSAYIQQPVVKTQLDKYGCIIV
jgi:hypothetical protein